MTKENKEADFKSATDNKKLFIETYGCQMNVADSEVVASIMKMAGYNICDSLDEADAVFMNSEPMAVVAAKNIADTTQRIAYQNIIFALGIKALVLILGLFDHADMWLAVFADVGVAVLAILNSMRALKAPEMKK